MDSDERINELYISTVLKLVKLFPLGAWVNNYNTMYMFSRIEQLREWVADDGYQISH